MSQKSNKSKKSSPSPFPSGRDPVNPEANPLHRKIGDDKISVEEALKMINEMRKMHANIDTLIEKLFQHTGWSKKYIETYLDNPNNFVSNEEWDSIQQKRKELTNLLKNGQELKEFEENDKNAPDLAMKDKSSKPAKERRSKSAPQRRKWLPMR